MPPAARGISGQGDRKSGLVVKGGTSHRPAKAAENGRWLRLSTGSIMQLSLVFRISGSSLRNRISDPICPGRLSANPVAMADPTDGAFAPDLDECRTEPRFHSRVVLGGAASAGVERGLWHRIFRRSSRAASCDNSINSAGPVRAGPAKKNRQGRSPALIWCSQAAC